MKLYQRDYINLSLLACLLLLIGVSLFTSDFAPELSFSLDSFNIPNSPLTGFVTATQSPIFFSANHAYYTTESYVHENITFYATVLENLIPVSNADCRILFSNGDIYAMRYDSLLAQYSYVTSFDSIGVINYTIGCNINSFSENSLTIDSSFFNPENTPYLFYNGFTLLANEPDLAVAISTTGAYVNQNATALITITNKDNLYSGSVDLHLNFSGNFAPVIIVMNITDIETSILYPLTYDIAGTYLVSAYIVPTENETITENNIARENITIMSIPSSNCGPYVTSKNLSESIYCPSGIIFSSPNIVLNCKGNRIYGDNSFLQDAGITTSSGSSVINCSISNYNTGVELAQNTVLNFNSIYDNNVGIKVNGANSIISKNSIYDNELAFTLDAPVKIQTNDITDNILIATISTPSVQFVDNYFVFRNYSMISSLITNSSPFEIVSLLNESFMSKSAKVILPTYGNLTIATNFSFEANTTYLVLTTTVNTNLDATCFIKSDGTTFGAEQKMTTSDSNIHTFKHTIVDDTQIMYTIHCYTGTEDIIITTIPIDLTVSILEFIDELQLEIQQHEYDLNYTKNDLRNTQATINQEINPSLKSILQKRVTTLSTELTYYSALISASKNTINNLSSIQKDILRYNGQLLIFSAQKSKDSLSNITALQDKVSLLDIHSSKTLRELLLQQRSEINSYAVSQEEYFKYSSLRDDLLNNYDFIELEKEYNYINAEIDKVQTLAKTPDSQNKTYSDYLISLENDLLELSEDLDNAHREEALDDLQLQITNLEDLIELKEEVLTLYDDLLDQISSVQDVLESRDAFSDVRSLENLYSEVSLITDSLQTQIAALDTNLSIKISEYSSYSKLSKSSYEESLLYRKERSRWSTELLNTTLTLVPSKKQFFNYALLSFTSTATPLSYVDLYLYKQSFISDPILSSNAHILGRYGISSYDLDILSVELSFLPSQSEYQFPLNISNLTNASISIYGYDGTWNYLKSVSYLNKSPLKFAFSFSNNSANVSYNSSVLSYFLVVYENVSKQIPDVICIPRYTNCTSWSACELSNLSYRTCFDAAFCSASIIVENKSCNYIPAHCSNSVLDADELEIDCGSVCLKNCSTDSSVLVNSTTVVGDSSSTPSDITPSIESPDSGMKLEFGLIVKVIVILVFLLLVMYFLMTGKIFSKFFSVFSSHLNFGSDEEKILEQKYDEISRISFSHGRKLVTGLFDYKLINRLIALELSNLDRQSIEQKMLEEKYSKEQIQYYLPLTVYCIEQIHNGISQDSLIEFLTKNGWKPYLAKSVVHCIIASYVYNYILNYVAVSPNEDVSILQEMFKLSGYDEGLIENAIDAYTQKDLDGIIGKFARKESLVISTQEGTQTHVSVSGAQVNSNGSIISSSDGISKSK